MLIGHFTAPQMKTALYPLQLPIAPSAIPVSGLPEEKNCCRQFQCFVCHHFFFLDRFRWLPLLRRIYPSKFYFILFYYLLFFILFAEEKDHPIGHPIF